MNWGKGIIISFVFFATFIGLLVTVCIRQQVSLVSKNYYIEELNYQQQIDQLSNASALPSPPSISIHNGFAELKYDDLVNIQNGVLSLYRPSDPGLDKSYEVASSPDSTARFDISSLRPGKYNVNFHWTMNDKKYLSQLVIVL